jgi:hypothetical protein
LLETTMSVTDPFTVACPSCGTYLDLTQSAVELDFACFDVATAGCPVCGATIPLVGEQDPEP